MCDQRRLRLAWARPVWLESSLCTQWVATVLSYIHADSEDWSDRASRLWSDWADAQADLSLRWVQLPLCWFCRAAAHFNKKEEKSNIQKFLPVPYIVNANSEGSGERPGAVARSEASSLGMQAAPSSIPTSGTFLRGDLVMKTFLRPFSLFHWFKKSSCQLLAKECALSTGKLLRRLAQEQCD